MTDADDTPTRGCVVKVAQYAQETCALLHDGRIQCRSRIFDTGVRTADAFDGDVTDLFYEMGTLCATRGDGSFWCTGSGQFEDNAAILPPSYGGRRKTKFRNVRDVAWSSDCVLSQDGLFCRQARVVIGMQIPERDRALRVVTSLPAKAVALSGEDGFACAVLENGEVYCRAHAKINDLFCPPSFESSQLPREPTAIDEETFTRVAGLGGGVVRISASARHACALKKDGTVWCWGDNQFGQLGRAKQPGTGSNNLCPGDCAPQGGFAPSPVEGLPRTIQSLTVGAGISCALEKSGKVWCWGGLPNGSRQPVQLALPEPARAIALGRPVCVVFRSSTVRGDDSGAPPFIDWRAVPEARFDCR